MTTIISNGYYLLADHRRTGSDKSTFAINSEDTKSAYDGAAKIQLLHNHNVFEDDGNRILAVGGSGYVRTTSAFSKISSILGTEKTNLKTICKILSTISIPSFSFIAVDEKCNSYLIRSKENSIAVEIEKHKPGVVVTCGSGATSSDSVINFLGRGDLETRMFVAAKLDKHTSPSYSVYGIRENKYFQAIVPTKVYIENKLATLKRK